VNPPPFFSTISGVIWMPGAGVGGDTAPSMASFISHRASGGEL
jgi:hypothetical protein